MGMKMGNGGGKKTKPAAQTYEFTGGVLPTDCSVPMCDVNGNVIPCTPGDSGGDVTYRMPTGGGDMTPGGKGGGDMTSGGTGGGDTTYWNPTYRPPYDPIMYPEGGGDTTPGTSGGGDKTPGGNGGGDITQPFPTIATPMSGGGDKTPGTSGGGDTTRPGTTSTGTGTGGGDKTPGTSGGGDTTPGTFRMPGMGGGDGTPGRNGGGDGGGPFPWPPMLPPGPGLMIPDPRRGPHPTFMVPNGPPSAPRKGGPCVSQPRMNGAPHGVPVATVRSIPAYSPYVPPPLMPPLPPFIPAPTTYRAGQIQPIDTGTPQMPTYQEPTDHTGTILGVAAGTAVVGVVATVGAAALVWWLLTKKG